MAAQVRDQLDANDAWVAQKTEEAKAKLASVASPFTDKVFDAVRVRLRAWATRGDPAAPRWATRMPVRPYIVALRQPI